MSSLLKQATTWSLGLLGLLCLVTACLSPAAKERVQELDLSKAALQEQRDAWAEQGADTSTLDALLVDVELLKSEVKARDAGEQTNLWLGLAGILMGGGAGALGKFGPSRGKGELNNVLGQVNREFTAIKAAFKALEANGSIINGQEYSNRVAELERIIGAYQEGLNSEPPTTPPPANAG